jgi:predicted Zn-dependent peptidase
MAVPARAAAPALPPPRPAPAALPVQELRLANGMRLLLVRRAGLPGLAAGWVAHVGSVDERPGTTGVTHFLEHMLFKGTQAIAAPGELWRLYTSAGARGLNALTLPDMTLYYVTLPAEKVELWFWLESDRLRNLAFRDFETERGVIAEERRERLESTPTGRVEEKLEEAFWGTHPYGWPTLGRPADLAALRRADAERHFATHYGPGNLTAALVGDFDPTTIASLAERYFGRLASRPAPPKVEASPPEPREERRLAATCECRPQVVAVYPTPAFGHPDTAALEVLAGVLDGRTGRLHRSLVLAQGIASSSWAQQAAQRWAGTFTWRAEAKGGATPEALLAAWDREVDRLRGEPVGTEELTKVRNQIAADAYRRLREPSGLLLQLLMNDGFGDWHQLQRGPERALATTAAEVRAAVQRYLVPHRRTVGIFTRAGATETSP